MTTEQVQETKKPTEGDRADDVQLVPLNKIKVNLKDNVRSEYQNIEELAAQIKAQGLLTPLTVSSDFKLIAGFRRHMALVDHVHKNKADALVKVTIVETKMPHEALLINIGENTGRENVSDYDLAKRLAELESTEDGGYGIKRAQISKWTGLAASQISKLIATYENLTPKLKKAWAAGYAGELLGAKKPTGEKDKPVVLPTVRLAEWAKQDEKAQGELLEAYLDGDRALVKPEKEKTNGVAHSDKGDGEESIARAPTKKEIREYSERLEERKAKDGSLDEKDQGRYSALRWVLGMISRP